jgi:hypothetical protein
MGPQAGQDPVSLAVGLLAVRHMSNAFKTMPVKTAPKQAGGR